MGKALVIFIVGVLLAGAYYSLGEQRAQYETQAELAGDAVEILSRNAALMGLDRAEQRLSEDFRNYNKNDLSGTYEGGTYETWATRKGKNRVVVRSTGTSQTRDGRTATFNIRAEYERKPWSRIANNPPSFMQYMLMAGGDLYLRGNADGHAYAPGDGSAAPPNADMHTNGSLTVEGVNASSEGFGTYVVAALPSKNRVEGAFNPNDNPTESDHAYQTAEVTLPSVNPSAMAEALLADSVTVGDVILTAVSDLPPMDGTRDDPYVWHIQGNLTILSGASLSFPGYVMLLIDGNLAILPNAQVTTPQTSHEGLDESTLAMYVGGLTTLSGLTTVWGQIFGEDVDILAEGQSELYGNIVSHGDVNFGGQAQYYYRMPSPALTTFWQGGFNDQLVRVAYSEW